MTSTEQKGVIMAAPFIFINSFAIKEGKLGDFRQFLQEFLKIIEANEPRLLALNAYVNEDGTEVTFVQVHPDAATRGIRGRCERKGRAPRRVHPPLVNSG
jgi:hypothetical protein